MRFIIETLALVCLFLLLGYAAAWGANWFKEQEDHVTLTMDRWTCTDYEPHHICVEYRAREIRL